MAVCNNFRFANPRWTNWSYKKKIRCS